MGQSFWQRVHDVLGSWWRGISVSLVLILTLTACGSSNSSSGKNGHGKTLAGQAQNGKKLKFVLVTPDPLGANEFLRLGAQGIKIAAKRYRGTSQVLESEDPTSRAQNLRAAVNEGANVVAVIGFEFSDLIGKTAKQNPNTQFLIIDQCIPNPPKNLHCAVFREYEATYLIGVEAGMLTKSGKIAAIGALDIPFLHRYTVPFAEGAKHVNPNVSAATRWVGNSPSAFSDPATAKEDALALAAQGYDQIFAAASASNLGIFSAAKSKGFYAYGVDVNQCPLAPGHVVDNAIKRVDTVTLKSIDDIMHGRGPQVATYGLKGGGMGLTSLNDPNAKNSLCVVLTHPDVLKKVNQVRQQIISGKITIQDPSLSK